MASIRAHVPMHPYTELSSHHHVLLTALKV